MSHGMKDEIDVADLLGHMSADELRELADKKDRVASVTPIIDGLKSLADAIERNPELLPWRKLGNTYINAWNHTDDQEVQDEWFDFIKHAIGGEWEPRDVDGYRIEHTTFGGIFGIELNAPVIEKTERLALAEPNPQGEPSAWSDTAAKLASVPDSGVPEEGSAS